MRTFEERMAEINRRSEMIFEQRRQRRKRILLPCIPLILCLGLLAALTLPKMRSAKEPTMNNAMKPSWQDMDSISVGGSGQNSTAVSVKTVKVSGAGITHVFSEPSDVLKISTQLHLCYMEAPESAITNGSTEGNSNETATEDHADGGDVVIDVTAAAATYTVTLTLHDGSTVEYCLTGNTLKERSTGKTCALDKDQLTELKTLLGISVS